MKKLAACIIALIMLGNGITAMTNKKYTVFLPIVMNDHTAPHVSDKKGVATVSVNNMHLISTGSTWFYVWSDMPNDSLHALSVDYVPMSYYGNYDVSKLSVDYEGYVLFLNEPNNPAPYGSAVSPIVSAQRYAQFVSIYPHAKMIVGNCSAWSLSWYLDFLFELKDKYPHISLPSHYGIHGYIESYVTVQQLDTWWTNIHYNLEHFSEKEITVWITEFAVTTGDPQTLTELLSMIESKEWIERYAYFTNVNMIGEPWFPEGWNVGLFENDVLTPLGNVYKNHP